MTRGGIVVLVLLAAAPAQAVDAPITAVTVFSDRARVTRSAVVTLTGRQQVALPLLGERVESGSIRLHSRNADVQTVDLRWVVGDEAFPRDEAREILAALDALDTDIARTRRDHGLHAGFDLLSLLDPAIPSLNAPRPAPKLGAGGWRPVIAFARSWSEKQQARLRQLEERLRELGEKRNELATRARRLGAERRRGGWQVTGTVTGSGRATLELTYMVAGARWYPSYDVLLDPSTQKVQVGFAGLVSQETGEDWNEALLTLSTAVPATTTAFPRLFTWKVGERERFIPKPRAPAEPVPPPPPTVPLAREAGDDVGQLRQQLLARAAAAPTTGGEEQRARDKRERQKQDILRRQARRDADADAEPEDSGVEGGVESGVFGGAVGGVMGRAAPAAPDPSARQCRWRARCLRARPARRPRNRPRRC